VADDRPSVSADGAVSVLVREGSFTPPQARLAQGQGLVFRIQDRARIVLSLTGERATGARDRPGPRK
jgi:hypothetical protein